MATKAQFDKFVTDKAEEKAEFDKVLEHTAQEAAQHKAVADKAMMDMGELQVGAVNLRNPGLARRLARGLHACALVAWCALSALQMIILARTLLRGL